LREAAVSTTSRPQAREPEFAITFVSMLPDEELTALVRRFTRTRAHEDVTARIERLKHKPGFRVLVQEGKCAQSYEHADAAIALCGAFDRLELAVLSDSPFANCPSFVPPHARH
jgi:lipid A disaccharide synthetase